MKIMRVMHYLITVITMKSIKRVIYNRIENLLVEILISLK